MRDAVKIITLLLSELLTGAMVVLGVLIYFGVP